MNRIIRLGVLLFMLFLTRPVLAAPLEDEMGWKQARANGRAVNDIFTRTNKMVHAWLKYADPETLLLPDRLPGLIRGSQNTEHLYTPHNSGADNYPYLIITAHFTEPPLLRGRMMEMLRNELWYTTRNGAIPANLDFKTRALGEPSFFGAGEYAKDGLLSVTELLGRTPWFYRMQDILEDYRRRAPINTRFGNLPDTGAELNGDVLQALVRLYPMTGDLDFLRWAQQIADAYLEEVLPANQYLPGYRYDFNKKTDEGHTRLRDHGNEMIVGLVLLHALETDLDLPRVGRERPILRKMLDRILDSANPDGMLYNEISNTDLKPIDDNLSDNWGYVYGAVYAFYQTTGEEKYRDAVLRVLRNLPKYRGYDWENGSMDGYADSIESALYLVAREPVAEALDWIESEIKTLIAYQQPDGTIERWYGDGNWNRTLLLYAMMKTAGCYLEDWKEGVELGAVRVKNRLLVNVHTGEDWSGRLCFDYARHRRELNLRKNYVRLNEWPEWFTVEESRFYKIIDPDSTNEEIQLGSELKAGLVLSLKKKTAKRLIIEPLSPKG